MAAADSTAYCYYCSTSQPIGNFAPSKIEIRRGVPKGKCRGCTAKHNRQYRVANPEKLRRYEEKRLRDPETVWRYKTATKAKKYGLTAGQYIAMYEAQNGLCAICDKHVPDQRVIVGKGKTKSLQIDHCHATGEVRALLCKDCNIGLGVFHDRPDLLQKAIAYLATFEKTRK